MKSILLASFLSLAATPAMAGWLPSLPGSKIDFTADELAGLDIEFHSKFDHDFEAIGRPFAIEFLKSVPSNLSLATLKDGVDTVAIMGGNLSKTYMTKDSLRLLICHEVGHFLGGGPLRIGLDPQEDQTWNVVEGGADYFASLQCLKRLMKGEDHTAALVGQDLSPTEMKACETNFAGESLAESAAICERSMIAAHHLIAFFAAVSKVDDTFSFDTPDASVAAVTDFEHPDLQCRLDTYAAGALCDADPMLTLKADDLSFGTCENHPRDERSARPRCWFHPADKADL